MMAYGLNNLVLFFGSLLHIAKAKTDNSKEYSENSILPKDLPR